MKSLLSTTKGTKALDPPSITGGSVGEEENLGFEWRILKEAQNGAIVLLDIVFIHSFETKALSEDAATGKTRKNTENFHLIWPLLKHKFAAKPGTDIRVIELNHELEFSAPGVTSLDKHRILLRALEVATGRPMLRPVLYFVEDSLEGRIYAMLEKRTKTEPLIQHFRHKLKYVDVDALDLDQLSKELSALLALQALRLQPKDCMDLAFKTFSCLAKARRRLTVHEIQIAVTIEAARYELHEYDIPNVAAISNVCADLIEIDETNDTVGLTSKGVSIMNSLVLPSTLSNIQLVPRILQLAISSITFLSFDIFSCPCDSDESLDARFLKYPFLKYASQNLSYHIQDCQGTSLVGPVLKFLESPGNVLSYLQALYALETPSELKSNRYNRYPRSLTPLHVAATLGHEIVRELLEKGLDISSVDGDGLTALHWAAATGNTSVVQLLLDNCTNITPKKEGTMLQRVTSHKTASVEISAKDNDGRTALHWAAFGDHEAVVLLLLVKGVSPTVVDNSGKTAMHWAEEKDHTTIVNFLENADPKAKYQLETKFFDNYVVHIKYKKNTVGQRRKIVETKWKRGREIGSGGFAKVYVEENERGQLRAVKELIRGPRNAKYARELNALAKLIEHQHLFIQFYGWYENVSSIFIAMEYIEHGDLGRYIPTLEAKPHAKSITRQLLEGLVVLHENKLCHRDLKPKNVLVVSLEPIMRVKITDFGVSKIEEGSCQLKTQLGTPGYMAPEQIGVFPEHFRGRKSVYTRRVDIWALGCLLHEILTKRLPFIRSGYRTETFKTAPENVRYCTTSSSSSLLDDHDLESSLPQIDMNLLFRYCQGVVGFPTGVLKECLVSDEGISLVEELLTANPSDRISAKDALKSSWLGDKGQQTTPEEIQPTPQISLDVEFDSTSEAPQQFITCLTNIPENSQDSDYLPEKKL